MAKSEKSVVLPEASIRKLEQLARRGRKMSTAELTKLRERIDASFRKSAERMRKEEEDRLKPRTTRRIVGKCKCGGEVVRVTRTEYKYLGDPMHMIIGPGYRNQLTPVSETETYCSSCKLMYSNSGKIEPKKKAARSR